MGKKLHLLPHAGTGTSTPTPAPQHQHPNTSTPTPAPMLPAASKASGADSCVDRSSPGSCSKPSGGPPAAQPAGNPTWQLWEPGGETTTHRSLLRNGNSHCPARDAGQARSFCCTPSSLAWFDLTRPEEICRRHSSAPAAAAPARGVCREALHAAKLSTGGSTLQAFKSRGPWCVSKAKSTWCCSSPTNVVLFQLHLWAWLRGATAPSAPGSVTAHLFCYTFLFPPGVRMSASSTFQCLFWQCCSSVPVQLFHHKLGFPAISSREGCWSRGTSVRGTEQGFLMQMLPDFLVAWMCS